MAGLKTGRMGVKSLSRYLDQCAAADESSKDIAKDLISLESQLAADRSIGKRG